MTPIVKSGIFGDGFDVNQPIGPIQAAAFKHAGKIFCIRYIPRTPALIANNLSAGELQAILSAGLAVGVVQHVAEPGWKPSAALGNQYGAYAALYSSSIGYPKGANVWLDLEEVATGSNPGAVINYASAWYSAVASKGYVPGLYAGWGIVVTPEQLYQRLPFHHYWNAYNGPGVAIRGCQLLQQTQQMLNGITYDPNISQPDHLGDSALFASF